MVKVDSDIEINQIRNTRVYMESIQIYCDIQKSA